MSSGLWTYFACVKSLVLSRIRMITKLYREVDFSFHPCKAQKAVSPVKRYSAEALIFTSYSVCIIGYRFTLYTHSKLSCCTRVLTIVVYFFKFSANSLVQLLINEIYSPPIRTHLKRAATWLARVQTSPLTQKKNRGKRLSSPHFFFLREGGASLHRLLHNWRTKLQEPPEISSRSTKKFGQINELIWRAIICLFIQRAVK